MKAVFIFLSLLLLLTGPGDGWREKLSKKGIRVYTRESKRTKYREFLAVTTMPANLEKVKEFILDVKRYPEWVPDCKSIDIIEKKGPGEITYHMVLGVPFPFKDRDIVEQIQYKESEGRIEVKVTGRPDKIPKNDKYTRIPIADGTWTIERLPDGQLSIKFQYLVDPGGNIPAWLANAFVVDSPYKTLLNLRKKLAE